MVVLPFLRFPFSLSRQTRCRQGRRTPASRPDCADGPLEVCRGGRTDPLTDQEHRAAGSLHHGPADPAEQRSGRSARGTPTDDEGGSLARGLEQGSNRIIGDGAVVDQDAGDRLCSGGGSGVLAGVQHHDLATAHSGLPQREIHRGRFGMRRIDAPDERQLADLGPARHPA
jgi:hypothetical protein